MAVIRPGPDDGGPEPDDSGPDPDEGLGALADPRISPLGAAPHEPFRDAGDEPGGSTETMYPDAAGDRPGWHVRLFGSPQFFRLWLVQVVSATGDWLGLAAIIAFANDLYLGDPSAAAAAISLVVSVRLLPGFFFAPVAGVLVDRFDRKRLMMVCDLARAAVLLLLPFADGLWALVVASLLLEAFTLLWSPAKEAITPHLVPHDHLTTANSLNLAAGYGTAPVAQLLFAGLAGLAAWLATVGAFSFLETNQTALAFYADSLTFVFSALMISRLAIPRRRRQRTSEGARLDLRSSLTELKEGWQYVFINPTVRAVNLGLATGLIGGGMLIPLGAVFATEVLDAGAAGYGLFTTALMFGVAAGVVGVSVLQKRLDRKRVFTRALFVAGAALFLGASASTLGVSAAFVAVMGIAVGPIYVLGFSILHSEVDDELRGRVFGALNTMVRFCVLLALVVGPLLAAALGGLSDSLLGGELTVGGVSVAVPGVRLTLWLDAVIIIVAGVIATHSIRAGQRDDARSGGAHPSHADR